MGRAQPFLGVNQCNLVKFTGLRQFGQDDRSLLTPRVRVCSSFCITALIRQICQGKVMVGEELEICHRSHSCEHPGAG